jgi:hypothetical protein
MLPADLAVRVLSEFCPSLAAGACRKEKEAGPQLPAFSVSYCQGMSGIVFGRGLRIKRLGVRVLLGAPFIPSPLKNFERAPSNPCRSRWPKEKKVKNRRNDPR